MANHIMRLFDYEMVKFLEKELLDNGVNLLLGEKLSALNLLKYYLSIVKK